MSQCSTQLNSASQTSAQNKRQVNASAETWLQKPVMLDVTDEGSLLQLIVTADIDPDDGSTDSWKNVSVEIKTVPKP